MATFTFMWFPTELDRQVLNHRITGRTWEADSLGACGMLSVQYFSPEEAQKEVVKQTRVH
jgi:hypothetical protein